MLMTQWWLKLAKIHKQVQEAVIQATAAHMCVNLNLTDLVATQWEDPVLKTVIDWIPNQKVQNLLQNYANIEEGMAVLQEWKKLMLYQEALYHCHTLAGKLVEALQFVVPKAHWVAAMNGCHHNARHKGQQQMLYLLQDQFLWLNITTQMHLAISKCEQCIQHEGTCAKAPMQPIIATAPLELLHLDFTSIKTTMELHQPPNVVNVLVSVIILQHMYWLTWPLTKLQRPLLNFYGRDTSQSSQPWPSSWGANFESKVINELCELMGIQKIKTSPYCAQTNGQVEQTHQTLMWMIGKLSKDQRADWPKHLPELVHAYNCTRSAITGYSSHCLMFGNQLHLPTDFYFPMIWGMEKHWHVNYYAAELCEQLQEAFKEVQEQSTAEAKRQKQYYGRKVNAILLQPSDLVLAQADPYKGKRKVKDWWEEELYEVVCQVAEHVPSYLMKNEQTVCSTKTDFLIALVKGTPLCTVIWAEQARCATTGLEEQISDRSETEKVPQSVDCLPPA